MKSKGFTPFVFALCAVQSIVFAQIPAGGGTIWVANQAQELTEQVETETFWLQVLDVVRDTCKEKNLSSVFVDTPRTFVSLSEYQSYIGSGDNLSMAKRESACWTREYWEAYVRARVGPKELKRLVDENKSASPP
jgi:hypothetical protein